MLDNITITDSNFFNLRDNVFYYNEERFVKITLMNDCIEVFHSTDIPFCFYHYKEKNNFIFTNDIATLEEWMQTHNYSIEYNNPIKVMFSDKKDINKVRTISNVTKISRWNTLKIKADGTYEMDYSNPNFFSVDIDSPEGADLLLAWIAKYKNLVKKGNLLPTLTGGIDTRVLTYFWKALPVSTYYLKSVKDDGKNNVEKGIEELKIAQEVLDRLGLNLIRTEKYIKNMTMMSGIFTENSRHEKTLNNEEFVYDYICHHFRCFRQRTIIYSNGLYPFVDTLYLKIRHPCADYMRTLLMMLLAPGLTDIRLYGFSKRPIYYLRETYKDLVSEVEKLIDKYNLVDRLKSI